MYADQICRSATSNESVVGLCFSLFTLLILHCICIYIVKREMLLAAAPNNQQPANQNQAGADNPQEPGQFGIDDDGDHVDEMDADPHEISTSDFIILQSSFECKLLQ